MIRTGSPTTRIFWNLRRATFDPPRWIYEIKFDGYRIMTRLDDGDGTLVTRSVHVATTKPIGCRCSRATASPGLNAREYLSFQQSDSWAGYCARHQTLVNINGTGRVARPTRGRAKRCSRLAQTEEGQYSKDNDDETDDVNDVVHDFPCWRDGVVVYATVMPDIIFFGANRGAARP